MRLVRHPSSSRCRLAIRQQPDRTSAFEVTCSRRSVTPASAENRGEVEALTRTVQAVTGDSVEIAWIDQGYTGDHAAQAAQQHGITLEVVKLPEAKRGFVLPPRRWVVERSFAWAPTSAGRSSTTNDMRKHS
ncbi:transposase [Sphingopyxis sp. OPL5]|nr:transposase [Sphingopyxis sp. OPL5]